MSTNVPAGPAPAVDRIKAVIERRNEWPGYRERPVVYPDACATRYPAEVVEWAGELLAEVERVAATGWQVTPDDWHEVADMAELCLEVFSANARRWMAARAGGAS